MLNPAFGSVSSGLTIDSDLRKIKRYVKKVNQREPYVIPAKHNTVDPDPQPEEEEKVAAQNEQAVDLRPKPSPGLVAVSRRLTTSYAITVVFSYFDIEDAIKFQLLNKNIYNTKVPQMCF